MTDLDHLSDKIEEQEKPWRDEELVNYLYHEEEMSGQKIADKLGCSNGPIYRRINDARSISEANKIWTWKLPLKVKTDKDGYERVDTKVNGEPLSFAHHRLIMVAEHGFDALEENIVHHKNEIPWDNRPENLELMEQSEHVREHFEEIPKSEKAAIWALGKVENETAETIGKRFGHSRSTITTIWSRIDSGDYALTEN